MRSTLFSVNTLRSFLLLLMAGSFAFIHIGDGTVFMPLLMWLLLLLCIPTLANLITLLVLACWGYLLAAALYPRFRQSELTIQIIITAAIPHGLVLLARIPFLSASKESLLCWLPCLIFVLASYFYILIRNH